MPLTAKKLEEGEAAALPAAPPTSVTDGCMHPAQINLIRPIPSLIARVRINQVETPLIIDSGANISILRSDAAQAAGIAWSPYSPKLTAANGTALNVKGQGAGMLRFSNSSYMHDFAIAEATEVSFYGILGSDFLGKHEVGISYAEMCLNFSWGSFPLAYNDPLVSHPVRTVTEGPPSVRPTEEVSTCETPRRVTFDPNEDFCWFSPPHDPPVFVTCKPKQSSEQNLDGESPGPLPNALRCTLVSKADGLLAPDAFSLVAFSINAPPGTPLVIHGIDLGEAGDPEPTFTTVNNEGQVVVMFKNTGNALRQISPFIMSQLEIEQVESETKVLLVNTTWEETILEPEICPLCTTRPAEPGKVCAACEEQLRQEDDTVEFWPPAPTRKKLTVAEKMAYFDLADVPPEHLADLRKILEDHLDVFAFPGEPLGHFTEMAFDIETGNARPVKHKPYRLAYAHKEFVEKTVDDLLAQGIIHPSRSEWAAPLLLVPKKGADGKTGLRCVIDFRGLNRVTKTQVYPYPVIQEVIDALQGKPFRICMDIASSYWQCEVAPGSRHKTAFVCHLGQFEWSRVPFGLKNAGTHFCKVMDQSFGTLKRKGLLMFVDDVMSATATYPELRELFIEQLVTARELGIKFNPAKCQFMKHDMLFLGHVIKEDGVMPDPEKTNCIRKLPPPETAKAVRSFLGMANFYHRFIEGYAEMALPLFGLTRGNKRKKISWLPEHQAAFDQIKSALCSPPCLAYPDFTKDFHLIVYGNDKGIGAALEQQDSVQAKDRRPLSFFSAKLSSPQQRYTQCQLECLAVVRAVEHFRIYLEGKRFHLYVRQASLTWLFRDTPLKPILARWVLRLQAYDFQVHNLKGSSNPAEAHALARSEAERVKEDPPTLDEVVISQITLKTTPLNMAEIQEQQGQDPVWSMCLQRLKSDPRLVPEYVTDSRGILYKREGNQVRLCVPLKKREEILKHFHDSVWGAHWGKAKMMAAVTTRFYWPGLKSDVEEHIGTCLQCLQRKPAPTLHPPLQLAKAEPEKASTWAVDIVGPLPRTSKGNRYILTAMDVFTRFPEACAIADQRATTVVTGLVHLVITRYGHIGKLVSDNGTQFTSGIFGQVCAVLGIKHATTSTYHPQSNPVEAMHKSLGDFLSIFSCGDTAREWDELIPYALLALRASVHSSTGCSPALLMTGQHITMPWDQEVEPAIVHSPALKLSHKEYLELMLADLQMSKEEAHRRNMGSKLKNQQRGEQKPPPRLIEGDLVLVRNLGPRLKLDPRWKGPYKIIKKLGDVNFELQHLATRAIMRFHASHLRELRREPRPTRVFVARGVENARGASAAASTALPPPSGAPAPPPAATPASPPAVNAGRVTSLAGPAKESGAIRKQTSTSKIPQRAMRSESPSSDKDGNLPSRVGPETGTPRGRKGRGTRARGRASRTCEAAASPARARDDARSGLRREPTQPKRFPNWR